jgi:hypothetical protein
MGSFGLVVKFGYVYCSDMMGCGNGRMRVVFFCSVNYRRFLILLFIKKNLFLIVQFYGGVCLKKI